MPSSPPAHPCIHTPPVICPIKIAFKLSTLLLFSRYQCIFLEWTLKRKCCINCELSGLLYILTFGFYLSCCLGKEAQHLLKMNKFTKGTAINLQTEEAHGRGWELPRAGGVNRWPEPGLWAAWAVDSLKVLWCPGEVGAAIWRNGEWVGNGLAFLRYFNTGRFCPLRGWKECKE